MMSVVWAPIRNNKNLTTQYCCKSVVHVVYVVFALQQNIDITFIYY